MIRRSHVAIWKWLQCINVNDSAIDRRREKKRRIKRIMIDESMITVKGKYTGYG